MKKIFNWLGLLLNCIYIGFMVFLIAFGKKSGENGNIDLCNILYSISTILFIASFALIPAIWDRTLGVLLPLKKSNVILVNKSVTNSYVWHDAKHHTATKYFLTFEFGDGCRKVLCVNPSTSRYDIFFSILPYETGTLVYKEQGKHIYFVSFTPDSTGQTIM